MRESDAANQRDYCDHVAAGRPGNSGLRVTAIGGTVFPHQHGVLAAARDAGAEVTLVGSRVNPNEGTWPWQVAAPAGLDTVYLEPRRPIGGASYQNWWYRALRSTLRRLDPDIVHVLTEPWTPLALNALTASAGSPWQVCVHGCDNIYRHGGPVRRVARRSSMRVVLPRLAGLASWNREGIRLARAYGLPRDVPTALIPAVVPDPSTFAPLDTDAHRAARAAFDLPEEEVVVAFIGRLELEKGLGDVVRALASLGGKAPFLAVWGAGHDGSHLQRLAAERGVRVAFRHALAHPEVARAMSAVDILVVPSRTTPNWKEQFGRVVVEGMLVETPVVAYDSGALPEVVGDGGLLVPEGDIHSLAETIVRLTGDAQLRAAVGARGRASALERFHPRKLAADLLEFWGEVLAR